MSKDSQNILSVIPVNKIENNIFYLADGSFSFCYRIKFAPFEFLTFSEKKELHKNFERAFSQLPNYTTVSKYNINYQQNYKYPIEVEKNSYATQKKIESFENEDFIFSDFFLIINISKKFKCSSSKETFFMKGSKLASKYIDLEEAMSSAEGFINLVSVYGVSMKKTTTEETEHFFLNFINFNLDFSYKPKSFEKTYNQIQYNDFSVGSNSIKISKYVSGEKVSSTITSPQSEAEKNIQVFFSAPLIYHNEPCITVTTLKKTPKEQALKDLENQNWFLNNIIPKHKFFNSILKRKDILSSFVNYVRPIEYLIDTSLYLIYSANSKKEDRRKKFFFSEKVNKMHYATFVEESFNLMNLFFSLVPGCSKYVFGSALYIPENAVSLIDFEGIKSFGQGDKTGKKMLRDRTLNPVVLDVDNEESNNNQLIIGPSGSGKTFTIAYIANQCIENNEIIYIIDIGNSYKNIILDNRGKYYEGTEEYPLSFNPFLFKKNTNYTSSPLFSNKITQLNALIFLAWEKKPTPEEKSVVDFYLREYYSSIEKEEKTPIFNDFYSFVLKYFDQKKHGKFFDLDAFQLVFKKFSLGGPYKDLLNNPSPTSLDEATLVGFDLKAASTIQEIYNIYTFLVIDLCQYGMHQNSDKPKSIYFEESWKHLKGDAMSSFIDELGATIRKEGGRIAIIMQSASSLINSEVGETLKQNCSTTILLWHPEDKRKDTVNALGLSKEDEAKLASLKKERTYREILVLKENEENIVRSMIYSVKATPEEYALLTTKPTERKFFREELERNNNDYRKTIDNFIEAKDNGHFN